MVLADQSEPGTDLARVIRMLILHDLVEIDVGDVPIHAANGMAHGSADTKAAEMAAAKRIFSLLPADLSSEFMALWSEFEAAETPDARFAKSLDRVPPVMANLANGGGTWTEYQVTPDQFDQRIGSKIAFGAAGLWRYVRGRTRDFFGPDA